MKYLWLNNILIIALTIILFSCNAPRLDKEEILSVSIEPQKFFLETIVGNQYRINCVIPPGSNPENFDPTPAQMVSLGRSKAYFKVGHLSFENVWINKVKENNPALSIIDCSLNISTVDNVCTEHKHGVHDGTDPHIWSSPKTAAIIAKNMHDAVSELDPSNTDLYTRNLNKLLKEFVQTDSIVKKTLEKAPSKSFLIYHPALTYFSKEYGLNQFSIEHEGKEPSASQLKTLIDIAKENNIKVIFIQKEYNEKNARTIAKEIGAKVVPLDLLSYYWSEEIIKIAKALALENE